MQLIDKEALMRALTTIDRLARSDAQAALLGRVYYIVSKQPIIADDGDFERIATGLKRAYEFLEIKAFSDKGCTRHAEMIKDAYMYLLKLHGVNADDEGSDGNA